MSHHDTLTLREALRSIQYEAASLADAQVIALQALNATYPARAALSATQPAQAAQSEPAEHWHRLYLEKCQQYNDRVAQLGGVIEGLEAEAAQGAGEVVPYAYAVYFPDQPTEMLVHDLDDLCEDMTNREHTVTQLYTQPAAGADVLDAVMYLLQDTRSYVCNCVVWRAKDGNGYTTDVAKAHRYTFDEAMRQHRSRDTDLPWPCDEVLPLARGHVDVQDVHKIRSLDDQRAAIAAIGRQE